MALGTNLVWILFIASVQCSYRQWHSGSWNNQNQNTNGASDFNKDNKQPWIINQAAVQNVPMWRDLALSTEQMKQPISNRWPGTQSNTNSLRNQYIPNQQSSQDIQQDMSNRPILQTNVNRNLWHRAPVSDILLAQWTNVNPTGDGKQEMNQRLNSNPWNQRQISANQVQSIPNTYLPSRNINFGQMTQTFMNQQPQVAVNNKPIIPSTENMRNQVPLLNSDITTWNTRSKPTMAEVNTNMNIQWNMNSRPIYDQNPTMYSWMQTPATVNKPPELQFTDNGNINNVNSEIFTSYPIQSNSNVPVSNNEMKPALNMQREMNTNQESEMNKNIVSEWNQNPTYQSSSVNGWSQMPLAENNNNNLQINTKPEGQFNSNMNVSSQTSNEGNVQVINQNINSNFQTNPQVNPWKPVRSSKSMNMQQQISEQNGYIIMKPNQINKPQLQATPSMNRWNQADRGNNLSSWFSSQISAPENNQPNLQSTTPKLQSDTKACNQISGGIASSTWNNNGNSVREANINTNMMPWNRTAASNKPSGRYSNDNLSEMNKPDQLSNNINGMNQIATGNRLSGSFINGNLPENIGPNQNVKLALELNTNGNKWNQQVAENIPAGWSNNGNTKNQLQSNNNVNAPAMWNTKQYQYSEPGLQLDFNARNQAVPNNVPSSWYSNTNTMSGRNINMQLNMNPVVSGQKPSGSNTLFAETNPDMNRIVKSTTTSNMNNRNNFNSQFSTNLGQTTINNPQMKNPIYSDTSFTKIENIQKPSPYLTVPRVSQPYNTLEPLKVGVPMEVPYKVPVNKNNNVGNNPNTIMLAPKYW